MQKLFKKPNHQNNNHGHQDNHGNHHGGNGGNGNHGGGDGGNGGNGGDGGNGNHSGGNGGNGGDENIFVDSDSSILVDILDSTIQSAKSVNRQNKLYETAFGFGQFCQGGNGGRVLNVTRLSDDENQGSFRWAVTQSGPRIIKFSVDDIIDLKRPLNVKEPRITIDGTGKTIVISGIALQFEQTHDVYIKNIRFRPGSHYALSNQKSDDALTIKESLYIYVENVSASWATDECLSINNSGYETKNPMKPV